LVANPAELAGFAFLEKPFLARSFQNESSLIASAAFSGPNKYVYHAIGSVGNTSIALETPESSSQSFKILHHFSNNSAIFKRITTKSSVRIHNVFNKSMNSKDRDSDKTHKINSPTNMIARKRFAKPKEICKTIPSFQANFVSYSIDYKVFIYQKA
jgi:hypothetical protein